jgi:hypothetical protein
MENYPSSEQLRLSPEAQKIANQRAFYSRSGYTKFQYCYLKNLQGILGNSAYADFTPGAVANYALETTIRMLNLMALQSDAADIVFINGFPQSIKKQTEEPGLKQTEFDFPRESPWIAIPHFEQEPFIGTRPAGTIPK